MSKPTLSPEILEPLYFMTFSPLGYLDYGTELSPLDYLSFARVDLEEKNGYRSMINTISNAKRALHLQVDTLCEGYGYKVIQRNKNFPEKLDFLQDLGLVTPRILKKLNSIRNKVEHDYSIPTEEDAELFCDVVELFLFATEGPINQFPDRAEFSSEACDLLEAEKFEALFGFPLPDDISFNLEKNGGVLFLYDISFRKKEKELLTEVSIISGNEYFNWLKWIFKHTFRRF